MVVGNLTNSDNEEKVDVCHQLEVVLEQGEDLQRRSNLAVSPSWGPTAASHKTSCFVHGLFHDERLHGEQKPLDVTENDPMHYRNDKHCPGDDENATDHSSRLLTKKQLADVAFSMRELSKRLGQYRLKLGIRNVFLLTKAHDPTLIRYTRDVAEWLLSLKADGGYTVYVEDTMEKNERFDFKGLITSSFSYKDRLKFWTNELCKERPHTFDIIIALGGDGTVLYASWLFQNIVPPVLSFALGSLGFLTKFDFEEYKRTLHEVFSQGLSVSLRLRLEATVMRAQRGNEAHNRDLVQDLIGDEVENQNTHLPEQTRNILNDLVIDRGPNPTMSSIEVFGDRYHITTVQADGICVATPTGSTAYNLAAGGSLCHPDNPVILVTAICAHTLSFRPIILPDTVVLRLGVSYDARASSWVSFDGKQRVELQPGDYVTISASRFPFPTVLPLEKGGEDWIDSLSQTLNWNSRQKQKPFKEFK